MSLQQWREFGWLEPHTTNKKQISDLLAIVERDLRVAKATDDIDWIFGIAYNAALKLCTILLYASGYRAARSQHHNRTLATLPLILGPERGTDAAYMDQCRMKRNTLEYDQVGVVSASEANELLEFVEGLRTDAMEWLKKERPELTVAKPVA